MRIAAFILISSLTLVASSGYPYRKRETEASVAAASESEENALDPLLVERDVGSVIDFNTGSNKGHGYGYGHRGYYYKREAEASGDAEPGY